MTTKQRFPYCSIQLALSIVTIHSHRLRLSPVADQGGTGDTNSKGRSRTYYYHPHMMFFLFTGGLPLSSMHHWSHDHGICLWREGSLPLEGGGLPSQGVCLLGGNLPSEGVCIKANPFPRYGQLAGSTHPTRMHSCFDCVKMKNIAFWNCTVCTDVFWNWKLFCVASGEITVCSLKLTDCQVN